MTQAINESNLSMEQALQARVDELESVMRAVLEQINAHQVYDRDARGMIRRALGGRAMEASPQPAPRRAPEFPSVFPSATSNFI